MIQEGAELSRRELNKASTRQAIAQAALDLLREHGLGSFTVDQVAQAAGISRRTFFNYFPSTEAAIASLNEDFLDQVIDKFRQRPADEAPLESAKQALIALADPMYLSTIAEVYELAGRHRVLERYELEVWANCTEKIIAAAQERIAPDQDPLYTRALVASVMACGKAAMEIWAARNGQRIDAAALAELRELLIRAIDYLGHGFQESPASP
ncbi:TetR/AcrR family transcriptional regulator [Acaricomes phytoseiuli]|uniref:TetR/AcrR family transcriptional regulator n=1 Tax=Acaricomes phytoseiuli TaxID=291968 RepID=UPI002222A467|nr:TetR/AcrR family transcriptional regulator [Acaricomes phytoseiuli]MCW1248963.1 TetR/AcrR family transcriptional regulator [Acaricomes phytoseiuli]